MAITFVRKTWINQIITRLGRSVTYKVATKATDNITGSETITLGTATTYTVVFLRLRQKWKFDKEGLIEGGDAYLIVKPTDFTPTKNSVITVDSEEYRIDDVITRYSDDSNATAVYHYCNLFLIS